MEINAIRDVFPATFGYQSHQPHLTPRRADPVRSRHHLARHFPPFRAATGHQAESNWTGRFHPGLNTSGVAGMHGCPTVSAGSPTRGCWS